MKREIMAYVPEFAEFIYACEGTGDNLFQEDIDAGYVDYVNVETYIMEGNQFVEYNGGMKLLTKPFDEEYADDDGTELLAGAMDIVWGADINKVKYIVIEERRD